MRRIPDVLDVWFDSGSMPFAQVHYPFENADWFEHHYPGDFIVEYIGQTRGWFYTLHVLATAIFDRPAFRNVMCHGIVLGDDGRKASKSLRNFPDPVEMWDVYGSDAVRWFLMSSSILRGGNLIVSEEGIRDGVRQVLLPLWSTYYFFTLYAGAADGGAGYTAKPVDAERAPRPARRWTATCWRARGDLVATVTAQLDAYDIAAACEAVREHLDVLTNWYVRTQRDRFWAEDADAFDTLWTIARGAHPRHGAARAAGHRGGLARADRRAQRAPDRLADGRGPRARTTRSSPRWTRSAPSSSTALGLRKAAGVRVRQPLRTLTVAVDDPTALGAVRRPARRRAQRQGRRPRAGRRRRGRAVRHHAAARGQRPCGRSAAGSRRPGGHPGGARPVTGAWTADGVVVTTRTATCRSSPPSTS